ncbi:MAG: FHA domain-containing protein [Kiritimatiellae bacterium]|nr:FHA domain-containing protein [Kiritimatiellia bacterium]MDD4024897.1 FHA domain-containing protein [Kiritimatiellia bacterium]
MACLIVLDGPAKGQRLTLDKPVTSIGRREDNDLTLPDGSVSGSHCVIEKLEGGLFQLRDLDSTNGTRVNNSQIKQQNLCRNDIIMIGEIPVMIEGDDVPAAEHKAIKDTAQIPRTTIVISQNRTLETPKEFSKKSNSNKIWVSVIAVLILVIGTLLFKLFNVV